jgi:5-methylcytosine-specific restriction enzyme A
VELASTQGIMMDLYASNFWILSRRRDTKAFEPVHESVAIRAFMAGQTIAMMTADELTQAGHDHDCCKGPNGRNLCWWCRTDVPKGRRNWCSDACVKDYKLHHDWPTIRAAVLARDKGVCSACGVDVEHANLVWRRIRRHLHHYDARWYSLAKLIISVTGWPIEDISRDWWEAHHVVARADGGPDSVDNLVTLCVPCHKDETRRQSRARAEKRKTNRYAGEKAA